MNSAGEQSHILIHHAPGFRLRRGRNWFFLGLTYASYYLCRYNLGPVSPELMRDLNLSPSNYGAIQTGRSLTYAIGQMVNGLFTDRLGGKRAMTIGGLGTIVMNLLFGIVAWGHFSSASTLFFLLIAIRMTDGYFQSFGAPGFIKINTAWFRRRERGSFAGIFGAMINLGAAGAPQLAKILSTGLTISLVLFTLHIPKLDWRCVFIIPPIFVGVMVLALNLFVKNTPEEAGHHIRHDDEPGTGGDPQRVKLIDVFRKIASNRVVWFIAGAYFCTGFVRSSIEAWWAKYLYDVWNAGKTSTAYDILSWGLPITATVGSMGSGFVSDKFFGGQRAPVAAVLYLSQVVLTIVALMVPHTATSSAMLSLFLLIGIAMLCNSTHSILGTAAAMDLGGPKMAGCSSGIIDSFQYYGAMLAGWGVGKLFEVVAPVISATTTADAAAKATLATVKAANAPLNTNVWLGSMIPFGLLGTGLMTYVWLSHRGKNTLGA